MKFNSQRCTSLEQSERLLALGLKKETADMELAEFGDGAWRPIMTWDWAEENDDYDTSLYPQFEIYNIPAWSLHRLMELYLNSTDTRHEIRLNQGSLKSVYEHLVGCIEWLIKEGYFNKEYLCKK